MATMLISFVLLCDCVELLSLDRCNVDYYCRLLAWFMRDSFNWLLSWNFMNVLFRAVISIGLALTIYYGKYSFYTILLNEMF
jgi:hypothetical protein